MTDEDEELDDATELLDSGSVPGMTLEEELLATEEEDVTELEDSSELELATELLDSSLDELRMTLLELRATLEEESSFSLEEDGDSGSVPGMTLEEELLATEEEDVTELEDSSELELATELLDSSLDELRMTLLELGATLEEEPSFSLDEEEPLFSLEEELATSPTTSQEPSTQFNSRSSS